jgi:hypothetical protein
MAPANGDVVATLKLVTELAPKVSVGLGTLLGIIAAVGQYAGAVAVALESSSSTADAIPLVVTATVTLITVIGGRMAQAAAALKAAATVATPAPVTPAPAYGDYADKDQSDTAGDTADFDELDVDEGLADRLLARQTEPAGDDVGIMAPSNHAAGNPDEGKR